MTKNMPAGTSIGAMKASLQWILSHTARFAGIVLVTIQGSNGFILINMGKPLVYYFRHGNNILKGHTAYEYFQSQPLIHFELRKYTALEMTVALGLSTAGEKTASYQHPETPGNGVIREMPVPPGTSPPMDTSQKTSDNENNTSAGAVTRSLHEMDPSQHSALTGGTNPFTGLSRGGMPSPEGETSTSPVSYAPGTTSEQQDGPKSYDVGELILGKILNLPGVLAVTIFRRGINVLSIGQINPDDLVVVAEDLIESAKRLSSVMRTGPFIQVTLQIPAGNIIIAPYYDEYICILTSPTINIGQIRKVIRELPGITATEKRGELI